MATITDDELTGILSLMSALNAISNSYGQTMQGAVAVDIALTNSSDEPIGRLQYDETVGSFVLVTV